MSRQSDENQHRCDSVRGSLLDTMERFVNKMLGTDAYRLTGRFLRFLRPFWRKGAASGGLMIVNTLFQSALPLITMYVIDHVFPGGRYNIFYLICAGYLALNVFHAVSTFLQNYFLIRIRNKVLFDIKVRLFEHLERQSLRFFHHKQSGYLASRSQRDVDALQGFMAETLLSYVMNVLTFCIGLGLIFWLQAKLALIALAILPFYIFAVRLFNSRLRSLGHRAMEKQSQAYSTIQERFAGIYTVFAFGREKYEAIRCARKLGESVKVHTRYELTGMIAQSVIMFIGALGPLAIMFFGGREIMRGNMTIGAFVAFSAYIRYLFGPAMELTNMNIQVQRALAAMARIFELFDTEPEIQDPPVPVPLPPRPRIVTYDRVGFRYEPEQEPVLRDISFSVRAGEIVALVGRSGAGKTTLVNLLPRFYDPEEGVITIDGVDIRHVRLGELRGAIGIVPQDIFLFDGTVRENIAYGRRNATDEEVVEAARAANAHRFISRLPHGYDTAIGERGVLLSGGEKQRIAIARAALKDPDVLILDEATASLDSESEALIQEALRRLARDRATLVIAHRLSTVLSATRILVVWEGRIIEEGNHRELYEHNGYYRNLYDTQFKNNETPAAGGAVPASRV